MKNEIKRNKSLIRKKTSPQRLKAQSTLNCSRTRNTYMYIIVALYLMRQFYIYSFQAPVKLLYCVQMYNRSKYILQKHYLVHICTMPNLIWHAATNLKAGSPDMTYMRSAQNSPPLDNISVRKHVRFFSWKSILYNKLKRGRFRLIYSWCYIKRILKTMWRISSNSCAPLLIPTVASET